jgi:hypothetical protein
VIVPRSQMPFTGARWCILCDRWKPLDDVRTAFGPSQRTGRSYGSAICITHDGQELSPRQRLLLATADAEFGAPQ